MSVRTKTIYQCDVCGIERESDYSCNGFTVLKFEGEEHRLRSGHACSKDCLGKLLLHRAAQLGATPSP